MTEEEIEVVAEELAKVGGVSWYPGRTRGPLLRPVSERYRDRARVAIAALERLRASRQADAPPQDTASGGLDSREGFVSGCGDSLQIGAIVVYRPPGDKRTISCRVEKLEGDRVYLVPCPKPDIGWVSLDSLSVNSELSQGNPQMPELRN